MLYMNEGEIDMYCERFRNHPVLGPATRFLSDFKDVVNQNSDGWCYWKLPCLAAKKLQQMILDAREDISLATPKTYKAALTPIKSFCTRHNLPAPQER